MRDSRITSAHLSRDAYLYVRQSTLRQVNENAESTRRQYALHLLAAIEQTLLDRGIHTSWATVRNTLKTHQLCTILLPSKADKCLRIRKAATPDPDVKDLYRLLDISPQIIKPIRTWSEHQNSD
jgi:hypothetical protein